MRRLGHAQPLGVPQPASNKTPCVVPESCELPSGGRDCLCRERLLKVLNASANSFAIGTELLPQLHQETLEHLIYGGSIATRRCDHMQRADELLRLGHVGHFDTEIREITPSLSTRPFSVTPLCDYKGLAHPQLPRCP